MVPIAVELAPADVGYEKFKTLNDRCFPEEPMDEAQFRALREQGFYVARHGARVRGFSLLSLGDTVSHIKRIAVLRQYRRRGIGNTLMQAMVSRCAELGNHSLYLMVEQGNKPAINLYTKFGFSIAGESVQFVADLTALAQRGIRAVPITESDRDAVPSELVAQLTAWHSPPRTLALVFMREGDLVGCTRFSPGFPGCSQFIVLHRDFAVSEALGALCEHALPDKKTIRITTDNANAIELFQIAGHPENYRLYTMVKPLTAKVLY